jgi:hypothetical protein
VFTANTEALTMTACEESTTRPSSEAASRCAVSGKAQADSRVDKARKRWKVGLSIYVPREGRQWRFEKVSSQFGVEADQDFWIAAKLEMFGSKL